MARLEVLLADQPPLTREIEDEKVTIGRAVDNDLSIDDESISGHHAEIFRKGDEFILSDLDSTNGTFLNEEQVKGEIKLPDGAALRFGKVDASFQSTDESPTMETPLPASSETPPDTAGVQTARPKDYFSSSPFPKAVEKKDPVRIAAVALALIAILAFAGVLYLVFQTMVTPTFPTP